ncbi:hypothetical protein QTJ16_004012 [Diplocarpon rosae]|uniref:Uncharacterized protein n=1 Tax=Diplocarpon rosae TaxID=946125 RepID=A0AAD9WCT9_9HELO|nr:hypothetical protein QTJ16_004012 [Diplocarpon rosae]
MEVKSYYHLRQYLGRSDGGASPSATSHARSGSYFRQPLWFETMLEPGDAASTSFGRRVRCCWPVLKSLEPGSRLGGIRHRYSYPHILTYTTHLHTHTYTHVSSVSSLILLLASNASPTASLVFA